MPALLVVIIELYMEIDNLIGISTILLLDFSAQPPPKVDLISCPTYMEGTVSRNRLNQRAYAPAPAARRAVSGKANEVVAITGRSRPAAADGMIGCRQSNRMILY